MKKNIVVCCEAMWDAILNEQVKLDGKTPPTIDFVSRDAGVPPDFKFCPWCGKELPFSYEEVNMFGEAKK